MIIDFFSAGFDVFSSPLALILTFTGIIVGLVVGAIPGLGPLMGIILLLPVAIGLPAVAAMGFLIAIFVGGSCGGSISAIAGTGDIGGDWQQEPLDGTLWFDTRQGRLFVAAEGQYWQTNGGDGLAHVSASAPTNPPVIGSTWFDTVNQVLYVFVGNGLWEIVKGAGEITLTTATLPLSIAKSTFDLYEPNIIPKVDPAVMGVQKDFNE